MSIVGSLTVFAVRDDPYCGAVAMHSCELPQKPQVVLCKEPDVGNVEQDHRETIHTEAERVAAPLFRIVGFIAARSVDRFEHGRVHHAATGYLNPLLAALESF